jgi:hypothetical protein
MLSFQGPQQTGWPAQHAPHLPNRASCCARIAFLQCVRQHRVLPTSVVPPQPLWLHKQAEQTTWQQQQVQEHVDKSRHCNVPMHHHSSSPALMMHCMHCMAQRLLDKCLLLPKNSVQHTVQSSAAHGCAATIWCIMHDAALLTAPCTSARWDRLTGPSASAATHVTQQQDQHDSGFARAQCIFQQHHCCTWIAVLSLLRSY